MSSIGAPSFAAPQWTRGQPYELPDGPSYVIPEVEARHATMSNEQIDSEFLTRHSARVGSWSAAGFALFSLDEGLSRVEQIASALQPEVAGKTWSLKLGRDGFVVEGDTLTSDQRDFLTNLANAMPGMAEAAKTIQDSAVNVYDSVKGNATDESYNKNGYLQTYALQYYKDVEQQLSGKVDFRALVGEVQRYVTNNGSGWTDSKAEWGHGVTDVIAAYLTRAAPPPPPP